MLMNLVLTPRCLADKSLPIFFLLVNNAKFCFYKNLVFINKSISYSENKIKFPNYKKKSLIKEFKNNCKILLFNKTSLTFNKSLREKYVQIFPMHFWKERSILYLFCKTRILMNKTFLPKLDKVN